MHERTRRYPHEDGVFEVRESVMEGGTGHYIVTMERHDGTRWQTSFIETPHLSASLWEQRVVDAYEQRKQK